MRLSHTQDRQILPVPRFRYGSDNGIRNLDILRTTITNAETLPLGT